ncbi:universal stress protein [soil metagenome]
MNLKTKNMKFHKILIAVDDGPTAEKVALNGFLLGQQLNAEIALLSVIDTTFLVTDGGVTPNEMTEIIKTGASRNQQLLIEKVFKDYKVWNFIEAGKAHEIILKVADEWEADLIVLGTHGRTGLAHLIMGSVAEHVIRHAKIPVLIVPSK